MGTCKSTQNSGKILKTESNNSNTSKNQSKKSDDNLGNIERYFNY